MMHLLPTFSRFGLRFRWKRDAASIKESSKAQWINSDLPSQSNVRNHPATA
jgi:hypothetical protein